MATYKFFKATLVDGTTAIADEVKAICTAAWTTSVKDAWKAKLIADKSST